MRVGFVIMQAQHIGRGSGSDRETKLARYIGEVAVVMRAVQLEK